MNHVDFPGLPLRLVYTANYPTGTLDNYPRWRTGSRSHMCDFEVLNAIKLTSCIASARPPDQGRMIEEVLVLFPSFVLRQIPLPLLLRRKSLLLTRDTQAPSTLQDLQ